MCLILSGILSLSQHLSTLQHSPELYCPASCSHCQKTRIWRSGCYYRKPDRLNPSDLSLNDIPIPRFQCASCRRTFSTLPECISPRRWYPWFFQHVCLYLKLKGWSINQLHQLFSIARSTLSRWGHWLKDKFNTHRPVLCSFEAKMGYYPDPSSFWLHWLESKRLSHAMVLLNKQGTPIP